LKRGKERKDGRTFSDESTSIRKEESVSLFSRAYLTLSSRPLISDDVFPV